MFLFDLWLYVLEFISFWEAILRNLAPIIFLSCGFCKLKKKYKTKKYIYFKLYMMWNKPGFSKLGLKLEFPLIYPIINFCCLFCWFSFKIFLINALAAFFPPFCNSLSGCWSNWNPNSLVDVSTASCFVLIRVR